MSPHVVDTEEQHGEDPEEEDGVGDGDVFLLEFNIFGDKGENNDEDVLKQDEEMEECLAEHGMLC